MFGNTPGLLKHSVVVPENVFLKYVFQMGGGGLRGKKFMFSQEASNFSFFNSKLTKEKKIKYMVQVLKGHQEVK